jgi:hypothetical protein
MTHTSTYLRRLWFPAKVVGLHSGSVDVVYDDGDFELGKPLQKVQKWCVRPKDDGDCSHLVQKEEEDEESSSGAGSSMTWEAALAAREAELIAKAAKLEERERIIKMRESDLMAREAQLSAREKEAWTRHVRPRTASRHSPPQPPPPSPPRSFVEVQHGELTADDLRRLLHGGVSFIVERAGDAGTTPSAIDVLSNAKYAKIRASQPPLGSVSQDGLIYHLKRSSQQSFIIDEAPADHQELSDVLRGEDDPIYNMVQASGLLQPLWVGRGQFQRDGVLQCEGAKGSQLVAFTKPPMAATPMHVDHQSFEPEGT